MIYNWQQADWGNFRYSLDGVEAHLFQFLEKAGHLKGLIQGLSQQDQEKTMVDLLVAEAIKTSEIENEYLSRIDIASSIRHNLGLHEENYNIKDNRAKGVAKLMTEVRKDYMQALTGQTIKLWHSHLFLKNNSLSVGEWRTHESPMQVISGRIDNPTIHFEAPPSSAVPKYMEQFITWFNDTSPSGKATIKHAPIRAAIAHIYFESIHPFEDGNGRIGRAIADKALSQSIGYPLLMSLSTAIEKNKSAYYRELESGQKSNEITQWLNYFVQTIIDAQSHAESLILFTLKKAKFFDRFRSNLNERQLKCINRMFAEGPDGFEGGMSARKYIGITGTSKATATRDLQALEQLGIFIVIGSGRSTRYSLYLED